MKNHMVLPTKSASQIRNWLWTYKPSGKLQSLANWFEGRVVDHECIILHEFYFYEMREKKLILIHSLEKWHLQSTCFIATSCFKLMVKRSVSFLTQKHFAWWMQQHQTRRQTRTNNWTPKPYIFLHIEVIPIYYYQLLSYIYCIHRGLP